jgi:hypothetical protein
MHILFILLLLFMLMMTSPMEQQKSYYCAGNRTTLHTDELDARGYLRTDESDWSVYLPCDGKYDILNRLPMSTYKIVAAVSNCYEIGNKKSLWENIEKTYTRRVAEQLMPATYVFPKDIDLLLERHVDGKTYVLKNAAQRQMGLKITSDMKDVLSHEKDGYYLVQECKPNCIRFNGKRINWRVYLLITCRGGSLSSYVYGDGIISYAKDGYDGSENTFDNTIASFYSSTDMYDEGYPITYLSLRNMMKVDWMGVENKMTKKVAKVIGAVKDKLSRHDGFQLFGIDILVDELLEPWIIEINVGPGMEPHNSVDEKMRRGIYKSIMDIVEKGDVGGFIQI